MSPPGEGGGSTPEAADHTITSTASLKANGQVHLNGQAGIDMSAVGIALLLHERNLHAFPVDHPAQPRCIGLHGPKNPCDGERGKHPTVKWGTWAVAETVPMIEQAWAKHGGLANVAIACGPSGLVVLDEDEAGELDDWCEAHGISLPATYTVTTGRGRHLYYRWDHTVTPIGNRETAFDGYHINVRGFGGYVVAAGSAHASGTVYTGNGQPIAPLTQQLADVLVADAPEPQTSFWEPSGDPNTAVIGHGDRHNTLVAYAGRLRGLGLDYHEAEAAFRQRWLLCEQPVGQIPEAEHHSPDCPYPVTWEEARSKLADVYGRYPSGSAVANGQAPSEADESGTTAGKPRFFDRDGLQVRNLADAVMRSVTCGFGGVDERLYVYDHGVWVPNDGRIEAMITQLLGNRYRNTHCRNVLDVIRHSPNTARITRGPLPEWINVRNGMIRWADRDRRLHPHSPNHLSTVQLPVDYEPGATCPAFERYLAQVLPKDCYERTDDSPGFIWELIGYTLYSGNPLHIAVLLYGNGRNGKGVLIRVLKRLIGERNCSTVTLHELVENRFRAATLFGKLANLAGDLDARWLDNTATFKAITGGDTVQGEYKYGAVFDFQPWALPVYSTNKAFGSADSSEGWVARWVVVPFPQCFIGHEDRTLDTRLQTDAELRGILRRAIDALPALMKRGRLPEPNSVREAKQAFITASDAVRSWLDEQCVLDPDASAERTGLYRAYIAHTDSNGAKRLSAREFYARLEQVNGISKLRHADGRGFKGVRLTGTTNWKTA